MDKIKNIEFLRVIGCITIVLFHLFMENHLNIFHGIPIYEHLLSVTRNGQKAVDLFFILSGFFFALKLNVNQTIWTFLKKKIIRLWPVAIFVSLLAGICSLFHLINCDFYNSLLTLLGFSGTSLVTKLTNTHIGQFWYVSTMLWSMVLFFYLTKFIDKKYVNLIVILLVYFSYSSVIIARGGKINSPDELFFIFKVGMLRAIGGIGLGYLIAEWYKNNIEFIKHLELNVLQKFIITGVEFCCLAFIISNLMFHRLHYKNDIIFIVMFVTIIVLFLIQKGWISTAINNSGGGYPFLAKYTYSIYMVHYLLYDVLRNTLWVNYDFVILHPILNLGITLALVLLFGVLIFHFVEEPCLNYLKQKR